MSFCIDKSIALFQESKKYIPGGVNSPVRAFKSVGGTPIFMKSASGAYMYDEDGNSYIDLINSWGPMILGHVHPSVVQAIKKASSEALSLGTPTRLEKQMAKQVMGMCPNIDQLRLVSSGTEACMSAVRLARGYTQRAKIVKFEGCYHGHADAFLVKAGSGVSTLNIETVAGVTQSVASETFVVPFNDAQAIENLVQRCGEEIACIIVEPVAGNMGCIPPKKGFLEILRRLCDAYGIVLIFDEVMTGFRLSLGGAQELLGVYADLVTYGKVIGGGMPVGAWGGKREIMNCIAPEGKVYQAGTLSGNPIAVSAGLATLTTLAENPSLYQNMERHMKLLAFELQKIAKQANVPVHINQIGSMMSLHFTDKEVVNFSDAASCDEKLFSKYFHYMLSRGIYLPPSMYESWFISTAIAQKEIDMILETTQKFLANL